MVFSIIIPAYNAECYIEECLASVELQSFRDFEVIIVDDGSTDATAEVCDGYASKREYAKVIHKRNEGPLMARRDALALAKGTYAVFLDADDCLRENALERCAQVIDATGVDIVAYGMSRSADYSKPVFCPDLFGGIYEGEKYDCVKRAVLRGRFNNIWGKAIRLDSFDIDEEYLPFLGLMHGEDLFQLLPVIHNASSLFYARDALYYYRPSKSQNTSFFKAKQLADISVVCERLLQYGASWGEGFAEASFLGESLQYCHLLKIINSSDMNKQQKRDAYSKVAVAMKETGALLRAEECDLRIDNKILFDALRNKSFYIIELVLALTEWLKRGSN